jgi:hypothetical protein
VVEGPTTVVQQPVVVQEEGYPPATAPPAQAPVQDPSAPTVVYEGLLSEEDDIGPDETLTFDGIVVELEDVHSHPLSVDLEIKIDDHDTDLERIPLGAQIPVYGLSGQMYYLEIVDIDESTDTIIFAMLK